jgi:ATP-dependent Zn protease
MKLRVWREIYLLGIRGDMVFQIDNLTHTANWYITEMQTFQEARRIAQQVLSVSDVISVEADDYKQMLIDSGALRLVQPFWQYRSEYIIESQSIEPNSYNGVWVDADNRVAMVSYYSYSHHCSLYLFASDIDTLTQFIEHAKQMYRQRNCDRVLVFTDHQYETTMQFHDKDKTKTLDDVILDEHIKQEIVRTVDAFFNNREVYDKYNIPYRRGILLYGKPGNGKTSIVNALASEFHVPVAYWQVNENTSSAALEFVFAQMKMLTPAILVMEDIDSLPQSMRSMFLNYLDGSSPESKGLLIIGTTNYPEEIDPALMNRAGRFDRAYEIKPPSYEHRYAYLVKKGLGNIVDDETVRRAAQLMDGFAMATLNELYTLAVLQHIYDGRVDIDAIVKSLADEAEKQKRDYEERSKVGFV